MLWLPGHPLADARGYVYEHRIVLFEKVGPLGAACHWCGIHQLWETLQPDHLDEDKANNAPENLVPSCGRCNRGRALEKSIRCRKEQARRMREARSA